MSKIYKFSIFIIFICLIINIFIIGKYSLAQGKGFFTEKLGKILFFDNLYINGFLAIEESISDRSGFIGDLLVDKNFTLNQNNYLYFCKDEKQSGTNSSLNKDCGNKLVIWGPENLFVKDLNKIEVNKLIGRKKINFLANKEISTNSVVKLLNRCFSNSSTNTCTNSDYVKGGVLKTDNIYYQNMAGLDNLKKISLNPNNLVLSTIDLGPETNLENQNICEKVGWDEKFIINDREYPCPDPIMIDSSNPANYKTPELIKFNPEPQSFKICCYLKITNF